MRTRRLIVALGLGACLTLSGCSGSSDASGPPQLTAEQKAEIEARDKATLDAYKAQTKDRKGASAAKHRPSTSGPRNSS